MCDMVSRCGFDLHLPKRLMMLKIFSYAYGHLYVFGEMSVLVK